MRKVIVNSTPLIALCHVEQLDILKKLYGRDLVIIDDLNAKKHAKYLGLPVTGTLGVLIKARQNGLISELRPILETMVQNHIYLKEDLIQMCLKQVGEK